MSKYLENLNEAQLQAVINTEGPSLVIAGAGSGKTRVLTNRIAHLLSQGVRSSAVLALTFTNKAAREMKERITHMVGPQIARYLWMGTFHSVFSRILRAEASTLGYPSTFTIYDTQDAKSLLRTIIKSLSLDEAVYKPGVVMSRISAAKNNLVTPGAYMANSSVREADKMARIPKTGEIYAEYARRCKNAGAMDFDDLLLLTNLLFRDHPEILEKYQQAFQYILVDEYQDTNFSQYMIVKKLAEPHQNICVVGDDAQSIYAFRGARIENILNFKNDYPEFKTYKLEQNYRSTQTIVNAANSLIAKNKNQIHKTVFSENESGHKIKVITAINDQEEGFLVANEIHEIRMREHDNWSDFAILYRTNAQSRIFEEVLRKRNIPYKIYGGLSFYQRKEIKDILAYFRLAINTRDDESFKRIINYPARGIGATTIGRIEEEASRQNASMWEIASNIQHLTKAGLNSGSAKKVTEFIELLSRFGEKAAQTEAFEMAQQIATQAGILAEFYQDKSPESISRSENIQELLNAIKLFSDSAQEEGRGNLLANFMEEVSLLTDQDQDKSDDVDKITMMTVHSSKGLEFNNVFIVGMEENLFPSGFSGTMTLAELEEERRLFYVALTRARKKAFLSCAQQRFRWGKLDFSNPSRFIGEIDLHFLDIQNSRMFPQFHSRVLAEEGKLPPQPARSSHSQPLNRQQQVTRTGTTATPLSDNFEADDPATFEAGMYIEHQRFGRGKIIEIQGVMPEAKAKVFFPNQGEKQLLLKFAKLKISR